MLSPKSTNETVSLRKFRVALKRLLSVSKEELDARLQEEREAKLARRKAK
jgi:hypothetical protein